MYMEIIRYSAIVLSALIALLALSVGGKSEMLRLLFYLYFPPARFYFNAMRGIETIETLSNVPLTSSEGELKQGIVVSSDVDFKQLAEILKENWGGLKEK